MEARGRELDRKNTELENKAGAAEQKAGELENQLSQMKNELEALQQSQAAAGSAVHAKTPSQGVEVAAKAQFDKQLPAILVIEGDVTSGHGTLIEADGKTWLYSSAQVFSGNVKLALKGADGKVLTKFGEFQVAADASLVRLEIQQEMPVKLAIDSQAAVEADTSLVAVTAGSNGPELQFLECRVAKTNGNDFELDAYGVTQNRGCPLFMAESGKVIAIFSASAAGPGLSVWPEVRPSAGYEQRSRAARLNRAMEWKPSSISGFLGERRKIDDLNKTTRLLHALASVKLIGETLPLTATLGGNTTVLNVLEQNAALPLVVELKKVQAELAAKKVRVSERDTRRRIASILSEAKGVGARQVQEAKGFGFCAYHRPLIEIALKWRVEADQALNVALEALGR